MDWPANKILVGKPIYRADAATGHLTPHIVLDNEMNYLYFSYAFS